MNTPEEHQDGSSPTNVPAGVPARGTSTPDPARVHERAVTFTVAVVKGLTTSGLTSAQAVGEAALQCMIAADAEQEALRAENERLRAKVRAVKALESKIAAFAQKHSASLSEAARLGREGRDPSFGDDWCDWVDLLRAEVRGSTPPAEQRGEASIGDTCCGRCPGDTCYVDGITGERAEGGA